MEQNVKDIVIDLPKLESKADGWEDEWEKIQDIFEERAFLLSQIKNLESLDFIFKNDIKTLLCPLYVYFANRWSLSDCSEKTVFNVGNGTVAEIFSKDNLTTYLSKSSKYQIYDLKIDLDCILQKKYNWEKEWRKIRYVFDEKEFLQRRIQAAFPECDIKVKLQMLFVYCCNLWSIGGGEPVSTSEITIDQLFSVDWLRNRILPENCNIETLKIDWELLSRKNKGWEKEWDKIQFVFDEETFINQCLLDRSSFPPVTDGNEEKIRQQYEQKDYFKLFVYCCNQWNLKEKTITSDLCSIITIGDLFNHKKISEYLRCEPLSIGDLMIDRHLLETHGPYWQKEWKKIDYVFKEYNFLKLRLPDYYSDAKKNDAKKNSILNDVYLYCFTRWHNRKTQSPFVGIDTIGHIFTPLSMKWYQQKITSDSSLSCELTVADEIDKKRGVLKSRKKNQEKEQELSPVKSFLRSKNVEDFYSFLDSDNENGETSLFKCTDEELERVKNDKKDEYDKAIEDINEAEKQKRQSLEREKKKQITQALSQYFAAPRFQTKIMQNTDLDFCAGIQLYDNYNENISPNDLGLCYLRNQTFSIIAERHSSIENEAQSPQERLRSHIIYGYKVLQNSMKLSIEKDEMKEKNRRENLDSSRYKRRKKEQLFLSFMRWYHPIFMEDSLYDLGFTARDSAQLWPQKYISFLGKNLKQWDKQPVNCNRKLLEGIKNGKFEEK